MNKNLSTLLKHRYNTGIVDGITAATKLFLLALYNVSDDYVDEDKQAPLARAVENELNRILTDKYDNDVGEIAMGHIEDVREKWRMD